MKRVLVLAALVVVSIVSAAVSAAQQAASVAAIQIEKVRDNLYLLRGGGPIVKVGNVTLAAAGTTAAFITASGIVLIDSKLPGWGTPILDKLKEISDKPVTTIINTHVHGDHTGGNVEFPTTVEVVAHETTANLMRENRPVAGGVLQPNIFAENNGRGLPTRTFTERLVLGAGDERIELHYFGRAHTGGDAWVVFPALRALHTGDVFAFKTIPIVDTNNGGSGVTYSQTIAKAVAALPNIDTVITGHYPTTLTLADLKTYGEFVGELVQAVQAAKKAGLTIDDFGTTWKTPERFLKEGYLDTRPYIDAIWNDTN